MDFTDFLVDKTTEFMTGYYYEKYPENRADKRVTFSYRRVNNKSKAYATIMGTMRADSETYVIQTNDDCGYKIGGYISTQDGTFWQISEVIHDEMTQGNEESLILFRTAVESDFTIRLLRVENPWGIK